MVAFIRLLGHAHKITHGWVAALGWAVERQPPCGVGGMTPEMGLLDTAERQSVYFQAL